MPFSLPGYPLQDNEVAFDVEGKTRAAMTDLLNEHITGYNINTQVLVIMSDIDEIPASHTVALLRACDFGQSIHLQLRNYLYRYVHRSPALTQNELNHFHLTWTALSGTSGSIAGERAYTCGTKPATIGTPKAEIAYLRMRAGTAAIASGPYQNTL